MVARFVRGIGRLFWVGVAVFIIIVGLQLLLG